MLQLDMRHRIQHARLCSTVDFKDHIKKSGDAYLVFDRDISTKSSTRTSEGCKVFQLCPTARPSEICPTEGSTLTIARNNKQLINLLLKLVVHWCGHSMSRNMTPSILKRELSLI